MILKLIKNFMKYDIYLYLKNVVFSNARYNEYEKLKDNKKIILMQTPVHSNLGDHAIAYAEREFVRSNFRNYEIIEVPFPDVFKQSKKIKSIVNNEDFIFIIGGGNMGDMYDYEEYVRRFIVKYFDNCKIISFPQTISFSSSRYGQNQLRKSKKIYKSNNNLIIVAREKTSYEIMKKEFGEEKVILTPDIVLSLDKRSNYNRKGILTCLRSDREGVLSSGFKDEIFKVLNDKYGDLIISDTITNYNISEKDREKELNKIWKKFLKSEIVITDRLHGMIFCAITATPCIVFGNSNHKIVESYRNWLADLDYIRFIQHNNIELLINEIEKLRIISNKKLQFNKCKEKYTCLINHITQ